MFTAGVDLEPMGKNSTFDVAIIGAGVTGASIAWALAKYDLKVAVIDKEADVAMGTSKANSGILHAGFAAAPTTLKTKYNVMGNPMFDKVCSDLKVHFNRCGTFVVAVRDTEMGYLDDLFRQGTENKVPVEIITDSKRMHEMEPELTKDAKGLLFAPTGGIVSPYELNIRLCECAAMNGTTFFLDAPVKSINVKEENFVVKIPRKEVKAHYVVNAAGLFSDKIEQMVGLHTFNITAWKGEYIILDKGSITLNHVLFPTPTKQSKGIVVTPTTHGNILVGPNNIFYEDREDVATTTDGIWEIIEGGDKLIPNLPLRKVIHNYAGLRAKADTGDFVIGATSIERFFNAAGIQSPGLSACLAIGTDIARMLGEAGLPLNARSEYIGVIPQPFRLRETPPEELDAIIKQDPRAGHVVCRCETVSEKEIVEAIQRPLGARTLGGIKMRVRAQMGRCQGGFCTPKLLKILSRELKIPVEKVTLKNKNSPLLFGRLKGLKSEVWQE
ncbi:MAG: FAD dependent oxidoreductase [Promethearchaeota archaeon CR_4]|nr:MAG: FAD dependent oxidoreductase [Candidatus Lokiarchaeota archaeon CR_4]